MTIISCRSGNQHHPFNFCNGLRLAFVLCVVGATIATGACSSESRSIDRAEGVRQTEALRPSDCVELESDSQQTQSAYDYINLAGVGWSYFIDDRQRVFGAMDLNIGSNAWPNRAGRYNVSGYIRLYTSTCVIGDMAYDGALYVERMELISN